MEVTTLSNGMRLIIVPNKNPLASVRFVCEAGSSWERDDEHGLAHFLEHFVFKGTTFRSYEKINAAFARIGDFNAYTSNDRTAYFVATRVETLARAIDILAEVFFNPALPAEEFEKERDVIFREIDMRNSDPNTFFWDRVEAILQGEQFGHNVIGTKESLGSMTIEHLRSFRRRLYGPASVAAVVVGDVTAEDVRPLFERSMEPLSPLSGTMRPSVEHAYWKDERTTLRHSSEQAKLALAFNSVSEADSLDMALAPAVFSNAIGGGFHSLLFDRIREKLGLAYRCGAFHEGFRLAGLQWYHADIAAKDAQRVEEEILAIHKGFPDLLTDDLYATSVDNVLFRVARAHETSGQLGWIADRCFILDESRLAFAISAGSIERAVRRDLTRERVIDYWARMADPHVITMLPEEAA